MGIATGATRRAVVTCVLAPSKDKPIRQVNPRVPRAGTMVFDYFVTKQKVVGLAPPCPVKVGRFALLVRHK